MAGIAIRWEHNLEPEALREQMEQLAETLRQKFGGDYHWQGNVLEYHYSGGLDARVECRAGEILVDVRLGMMMGMMKGRIRSEIEGYLERHLS